MEKNRPEDVISFLELFKVKAKVFGIIFRDDRNKNRDTLLALGISPMQREQIILGLMLDDYVQGPLDDMLNGCEEMWVFGKVLKGQEVYIKITLGCDNASAVCISFHVAEYPLTYPYKTKNK